MSGFTGTLVITSMTFRSLVASSSEPQ